MVYPGMYRGAIYRVYHTQHIHQVGYPAYTPGDTLHIHTLRYTRLYPTLRYTGLYTTLRYTVIHTLRYTVIHTLRYTRSTP